MLFNSINFLIFFPAVTLLFFSLPARTRWMFLLLASYFFYACWKPEYLILLLAVTAVNYFCGLGIESAQAQPRKKFLLALSIAASMGVLVAFKYLGFFSEAFAGLLGLGGIDSPFSAPRLLLPVGVSFYTFQATGYTIDVYLGKVKAEKRPGVFGLFVGFFPQVMAGPIGRAGSLIPQFIRDYSFDPKLAASGMRLMLWGYFKKIVIADRLSIIVDHYFTGPQEFGGPALALATVFFTIQIYCDFSGYSDIAIGAARVLGIKLMTNFDRPYHAKSIPEFWRRWHISLSTWFRDYLYIPLGGRRVAVPRWYFNLLFVFVVSGLWHGADWTFVFWGFLHGVLIVSSVATTGVRGKISRALKLDSIPAITGITSRFSTFCLVAYAWIFFRADSLEDALCVATGVFSGWGSGLRGVVPPELMYDTLLSFVFIGVMEMVHVIQGRTGAAAFLDKLPRAARWGIYYLVIITIILFGEFGQKEFIYFQF